MAPSVRSIPVDEQTLEADIMDLADRSAAQGLSDLVEHIHGVAMPQWDLGLVHAKLDDLTCVGGHMARDAREALNRLRELA